MAALHRCARKVAAHAAQSHDPESHAGSRLSLANPMTVMASGISSS
jgi:hypothetical protein